MYYKHEETSFGKLGTNITLLEAHHLGTFNSVFNSTNMTALRSSEM
jgi:hypothetical protein